MSTTTPLAQATDANPWHARLARHWLKFDLFLCAVVLLVTHAQTHLTVALIGVAITILTLICFAKDAKEIIRGVDGVEDVFVLGGSSPTGDLDIRRASVTVLLYKLDRLPAGEVSLESLLAANLVPSGTKRVKLVKKGEVSKAFVLKGVTVTAGARVAIEAAGGRIEE